MSKKKLGEGERPGWKIMNVAYDAKGAKKYLVEHGFSDAANIDHLFTNAVDMATEFFTIFDSYLEDRDGRGECIHSESLVLACALLTSRLMPERLKVLQMPTGDPRDCFEAIMLLKAVSPAMFDAARLKAEAQAMEGTNLESESEPESEPEPPSEEAGVPPRERMH